MTDPNDSRISDEPTRGWVDDELGLILNPGSALRDTAAARAKGALAGAIPDEPNAATTPSEARKQPA